MKLIFVFLALLLTLKTVGAVPVWSNAYPSVSGATYFPNEKFNFQINWTGSDSSYKVSNVLFESNFSGYLSNITPSNKSNTYFVNFTGLPANSFVYRWYAVDNDSNWNSTEQLTYTINKNSTSIKLYLNGAQTNKEYVLNKIANFTAFLNVKNKTIYLDSNYTNFVLQSSSNSLIIDMINLTSSGLFSITAYWNGDENYSASSQTYYFDNIPPRYITRTELPIRPANYSPYAVYEFGSTWYSLNISQVLFESNFSGSFKNYSIRTNPPVLNKSSRFFIDLAYLPAETFLYRWIAFDSANKVSNSTRYEYDILKGSPLSVSVTPSETVLTGTKTTVICSSSTNQVQASNFKLYRNGTLIGNDTLQSRKDEQMLSEGVYEYVCNSTRTQNFTSQTIEFILSVSQTTPSSETALLNLTGPSSIQAYTGGTAEATLSLENNLGYSVTDLSLSVSGLPDWYNFNELPASIPSSFLSPINLNINVPSDAEPKDYSIIITATIKTPLNEFKTATKTLTLTVETLPQNFPPVYSTSLTNEIINGYEFSLKWDDDSGLTGYVFSSNISGIWKNDSLVTFTGTENWSNVTKNINLSAGQTIAWKVYATDTNDLWTGSQEFYLTSNEKKPSIFYPIMILSVFVIGLEALLLLLTQRKSKKVHKKENVVYVYRKGD